MRMGMKNAWGYNGNRVMGMMKKVSQIGVHGAKAMNMPCRKRDS